MIKTFLFSFLLIFAFNVKAQETNIERNFLLGKFDYRKAVDFEKVHKPYASKPIYLNAVVFAAFREMYQAALEDGVKLIILSGTRSFEEQKMIWEKKWKILTLYFRRNGRR